MESRKSLKPKPRFKFKNLFKNGLFILISTLSVSTVVWAGSITAPAGSPSAKFYTLSEIYNFITANTTATEGDHSFTFSDTLAGTGRTLTEIYDALAGLISADKVKSGTTYLNVAGTLTPDGGTATTAGVFNGLTAHLSADWTLDTGTLNLACNTATFDASGNLIATAYDGAGDGTDRWCMTNSGDAIAGEILSGKIAWVDGLAITGTLPTQTLSAISETLSAGYYAETTLSAVDADLTTNNIKSGITIFGVVGNSNVVDTTSGDAVAGNLLSGKIAWVDGAEVTGTMSTQTLSALSETLSAGYYAGTTLSAVDADLATGNIKSGITIFGVAGNSNVVDTTSGDATAAQMKTGVISWVDGAEVTGSGTQTLSAANATVNAGYYEATTLDAVDTDLAAANILSGKTIFGVAGSATSGGYPRTGQTTCTDASGNSVSCAGTGQDGEHQKGTARSYTSSNVGSDYIVTDNATGWVWQKCSKGLSGATCATGVISTDTWANALTYCNDLDFAGQTDWRLPNAFELASLIDYGDTSAPFIDATNFPATPSNYYWTSTSRNGALTGAKIIQFDVGNIFNSTKTNSHYIRCVRGG